MTVHVDNLNAKYGRMTMCHILVDSTDELLTMVDNIGASGSRYNIRERITGKTT